MSYALNAKINNFLKQNRQTLYLCKLYLYTAYV